MPTALGQGMAGAEALQLHWQRHEVASKLNSIMHNYRHKQSKCQVRRHEVWSWCAACMLCLCLMLLLRLLQLCLLQLGLLQLCLRLFNSQRP